MFIGKTEYKLQEKSKLKMIKTEFGRGDKMWIMVHQTSGGRCSACLGTGKDRTLKTSQCSKCRGFRVTISQTDYPLTVEIKKLNDDGSYDCTDRKGREFLVKEEYLFTSQYEAENAFNCGLA